MLAINKEKGSQGLYIIGKVLGMGPSVNKDLHEGRNPRLASVHKGPQPLQSVKPFHKI